MNLHFLRRLQSKQTSCRSSNSRVFLSEWATNKQYQRLRITQVSALDIANQNRTWVPVPPVFHLAKLHIQMSSNWLDALEGQLHSGPDQAQRNGISWMPSVETVPATQYIMAHWEFIFIRYHTYKKLSAILLQVNLSELAHVTPIFATPDVGITAVVLSLSWDIWHESAWINFELAICSGNGASWPPTSIGQSDWTPPNGFSFSGL